MTRPVVRATVAVAFWGTQIVTPASIRGVVMDAANDRPIADAVVSLSIGSDASTMPGDASRRCARPGHDVAVVSAVRTDALGAYLFANLTPGRYTLCVRAVGYVPRALVVTLDAASASRVHVGLPAVLTVLAPVRVTRVPDAVFNSVRGGSSALPGAELERLRQMRYLTSDARILTRNDVTSVPGLGELDVLRAVQQLPGVATRDDYTVSPWTRGASGDQTMIIFDGLPLFDPFHSVGAISGVNADAIGDAAFHPGVAPTELAGGAAGTLVVRSRRPSTPGVGGALGVSTIAASGSVDGATRGGRAAGTLSVRRSHVDLTNRLAARLGTRSDRGLPYAFSDATGRGDLALGRWLLEGSALVSRDRLWAPIAGIVDGGTGRWGARMARLTLARGLLGGTMRASAGVSVARTSLLAESDARLEPAGLPQDSSLYAIRETVFRPQPIDSRADMRLASVTWHEDADAHGLARMAVGVDVAAWRARFATEGPWPHSAQFIDTISVHTGATITTFWADRTWRPTGTLTARTGARLELGAEPRNAPRVRLAPRFTVRYAPSRATSVSLAAGGAYQHAQTLAPPGPGRNAVATTDAFWVVSGPEVPLLATRIATVGVEQWLVPWLLASATAYRRDDAGVVLPDPREGYLVDRPLAVEGTVRATGLEASVRAFDRRWTGGLSSTLGKATVTAYGLHFASPSERPQVVRANGAIRVWRSAGDGSGVRVGLAWEYAAGAPFTRYYGSVARCDAQRCRWEPPPRIGPPSESRARPTQRLDAMVDGAWTAGSVRVDGYAQLRNVTRAPNDAAYLASVGQCSGQTQGAGTCQPELFPETTRDTRLPPLRGWLSVGVRLSPRRAP